MRKQPGTENYLIWECSSVVSMKAWKVGFLRPHLAFTAHLWHLQHEQNQGTSLLGCDEMKQRCLQSVRSSGPCLLSWSILRSGCRFRGSRSQYISQADAQGSSENAKENSHQQQGQEERVAERQEAQSPQETLAGETKYAQKSPAPREGWRLEVWKQAGKGAP